MNISIVDYQLPDDTHNLYDVTFFGDQIHTLLTHTPSMVDSWISETERLNPNLGRPLLVGLDVEWRPNFNRNVENPIATLQLCVGRRCLVFQILHASKSAAAAGAATPKSLVDFLGNASYTFVGVGIESDVEKLLEDYDLGVANRVDLRPLAAEKMGDNKLKQAGVKGLAMAVLGKEIGKPKKITMSRWDYLWLTSAQVQYACIDAFLCYEIGRTLYA